MKQIELTQGYVALVDDEDFEKVSQHKWYSYLDKRPDGTVRAVYAQRNFYLPNGLRTRQRLHRFIVGVEDPSIQVDHENHQSLNCCRYNLRVCTNSENSRNSRKRKGTSSKYKGVHWDKRSKSWRAMIYLSEKRRSLGYYPTEEQAAKAYDAAAVEVFGEFANTNFYCGEVNRDHARLITLKTGSFPATATKDCTRVS